MLVVQVDDQMYVFVVDRQVRIFTFYINSYGDVILFLSGNEESRRVSVALLGPVFGDELGKRFLVLHRENQNRIPRVQVQARIERLGVEETNLFELVGEAARRILPVVACYDEMRRLDLDPGFQFVGRGWFTPPSYPSEQSNSGGR